jgi:hypothetical protein
MARYMLQQYCLFFNLLLLGQVRLFFHASSSTSNFSFFAIECLIPSWTVQASLLFTLLVPISFAFVGMIAWCAAHAYSYVRVRMSDTADAHKHIADPRLLRTRAVKVVVFLLNLHYFNVVVLVLQMFACTSPTTLNEGKYLNAYPLFLFFCID